MKKLDFDDQHITIKGWMTSKLGLSGNRLTAFALVHGFSQDGTSEFRGSISYIQKWLGCSRPTAISVMASLTKDGLTKKRKGTIDGKPRNFYVSDIDKIHQLKNFTSKETLPTTSKETLPSASKETLPNNISNNISINNKGKFDNLQVDRFKKIKGLKSKIGPTHYKHLNKICEDPEVYSLLKGLYQDGRFNSLMDWLEYKKEMRQTFKRPSSVTGIAKQILDHTPLEVELGVSSSKDSEYRKLVIKRISDDKMKDMEEKTGGSLFVGLKKKQA